MITALLAVALAPTRVPPELLAIWRKQDAHGMACASCHSPDGIELAAFRFPDNDLIRRATKHLPEPDRPLIVRLVELQRKNYTGPTFDPMSDRPLQPGGREVLGTTAAERDFAFGKSLHKLLPTLTGPPIRSFEAAQRARNELLKLDLRRLPVGFEMNRLSEDGFHGSEHASIASWVPDVPVANAAVERASDVYLANPTLANLARIDSEVLKIVPKTPFESISIAKYRSLLVLQHRLRTGYRGSIVLGKGIQANPMWGLGEEARLYVASDRKMLAVPADVAQLKSDDYASQFKAMETPWLWLGWTEDPGLVRSGLLPETLTGHYLVQSLASGPYPMHAALFVAKRFCQRAFAPGDWPYAKNRHPEIEFSGLFASNLISQIEPTAPEAKRQYKEFLGNTLTMMLYLGIKDLETTREASHPEAQIAQVKFVQAYVGVDQTLINRELLLLKRAHREG